jgi:hypothetical protein
MSEALARSTAREPLPSTPAVNGFDESGSLLDLLPRLFAPMTPPSSNLWG